MLHHVPQAAHVAQFVAMGMESVTVRGWAVDGLPFISVDVEDDEGRVTVVEFPADAVEKGLCDLERAIDAARRQAAAQHVDRDELPNAS